MTFLQSQDSTPIGVDLLMKKAQDIFFQFPRRLIGIGDSSRADQAGQNRREGDVIRPGPDSVQLPVYDIDTYQPWNYASVALETERTGLIK
jgi:hypothetical protein